MNNRTKTTIEFITGLIFIIILILGGYYLVRNMETIRAKVGQAHTEAVMKTLDEDGCQSYNYQCHCIADCVKRSDGEFIRFISGVRAPEQCMCKIEGKVENIW